MDKRHVVLLDELDKAPRDLPNDVLAAIEDLEFQVPEIGKSFRTTAENRPIIVLTSNSEKNLPDPFLCRWILSHSVPRRRVAAADPQQQSSRIRAGAVAAHRGAF